MIDTIRRKVLFGFLGAMGLAKAQLRMDGALGGPRDAYGFSIPRGLAKAQDITDGGAWASTDGVGASYFPGTGRHELVREPRWLRTGAALNGQCPVCGTQAPPLPAIRYPITTNGSACPVPPEGTAHAICVNGRTYFTQRLERCARCNNAFYQDAEGI